jgi:anti-sigma regulatory factor (Ser/Thr protein kinase)
MLTRNAVRAMATVPGCERSVPEARAFVDGVLGTGHPDRETARLLVSELVTNAIQHSESRRPGGTVSVIVADVPGGVRIEVTDEGSLRSVPVVRDDPLAPDGRGLLLVATLAHDWGYQRDGAGTTVWFRLGPLPRPVSRPLPRPARPGRCAPGRRHR